jgi:diguanylate cyclase (GGDEF)-like protein
MSLGRRATSPPADPERRSSRQYGRVQARSRARERVRQVKDGNRGRLGEGVRKLRETMVLLLRERLGPLAQAIERSLEQRVALLRKQWEESDYEPDNPIHRLRGQFLIWMFSFVRRLRRSHPPARSYVLPVAISVGALVLTSFVHSGALLILLAAVLVGVRVGGLRAGLVTAALCLAAALNATWRQIHGPGGGSIVVALLCYVSVSLIACILVDSLEAARRDLDGQRAAAETVARRFRFLAEATAMLEAEYTYEAILSSVTRAIVPAYADWATADVFRDGQLRRTALAHRDDGVAALLRSAQRGRALSIPQGHPLYEALAAREARIIENVTDAVLAPLRLDYQDAPRLKPAHLLFIPLMARNRLLGALTLISTSPERPFAAADLFAAQDLALRVGTAMDNLRLYYGALDEAAENARREREAASQKDLLEQQRTELVAQNARLAVEATTDGLTGLLNHLTFKRRLDTAFLEAQRTGRSLTVALLDVDRFKSYNDQYGHPAGDDVLRRMAAIMTATTRDSDVVARYGGEEFVIVMTNTEGAGALEMMERLRRSVEAADWPHGPVTASFGLATMHRDTAAPSDLIHAADEALYRSKLAGRNRSTHADVTDQALVMTCPVAPALRVTR